MESKYLRYILILIFTVGIYSSSFSQITMGSLNLNKPTSKQIEKEKAKWERQRINSTIIDKKGQTFEGQILYLNDSLVYQYLSREAYKPDELLNSTIKFNIDDIEQINIYRKGQTLRGLKIASLWGVAGTLALTFLTEESAWGRLWNLFGATIWVMPVSSLTGVIVGSGKKIDVQYKSDEPYWKNALVFNSINKYALYPTNPPPGLFVNNKLNINSRNEFVLNEKGYNKDIISYNKSKSPSHVSKFHIQTGVGLSVNYLKHVLRNDLKNIGYYEDEIRDPLLNDLNLDLGFAYQIDKNLRLFLNFQPKSYWTEGLYKQKLNNQYFVLTDTYSYGSITALGVNYIFGSVTRDLNKRLEILFGMGVAYSSLTVDHSLLIAQFDKFSTSIYESNDMVFYQNKLGIKTQIELDYYLSRNFSLYLKTGMFYLPHLTIPELSVTSEYLNLTGTLNAHQTNISTINCSVGLKVHF